MLDIPRMQRIGLSRYPVFQKLTGYLVRLNFRLLPGVEIEFEHAERLPPEPVIFAMNHTDRYNYFPFQIAMWTRYDRFTAAWVKGKYYESQFVGLFMEKTNQLPTISRGYLIAKDFSVAVGRKPRDDEYEMLRRWVDAAARGSADGQAPAPEALPEALLSQNRNVLGYAFDTAKEDYASYINSIFRIMMRQFVALNEEAVRIKLDTIIFPQGTRSLRLLPARPGISQMALHTKIPIVPVACQGSEDLYPSGSPWAKKGRAVYRIGEPIEYADISQFHIEESYEPFSAEAESKHHDKFQGLADLVTQRIDDLLDEPYKLQPDDGGEEITAAERFI
jgi:1-acyl-sn-glycerol-3-phosphate acyltransferase